jgi:hypothetical protein
MWSHLPLDELHRMPRDPGCSSCRNVYDLQRLAAVASLDRRIVEAGPDGYATDAAGFSVHVDDLLDRRRNLIELLRTGPHA